MAKKKGNRNKKRGGLLKVGTALQSKPRPPRLQSDKGTKLSVCAQKYAVALTDPSSEQALGACIPAQPSFPSQKVRGFVRFPGSIGTNGWGFVAVIHTMSNDAPTAYVSNAAWAGVATIPAYAAASGMDPVYMTNLPYNHTQMTTLVDSRLVASGVRLQYTGTTLNESGLVHALHQPEHLSTIGYTSSSMMGFSQAVMQRVSDRVSLMLNGYQSNATSGRMEDNYRVDANSPWPWASSLAGVFPANGTFAGGNAGAPVSVFLISGVAGQTFMCEMWTHCEFGGALVQAMVTPSHADPVGRSLVLQAAQLTPVVLATEPDCPPICAFMKVLKDVVSEVIPVATSVVLGPAAGAASRTVVEAVRRLF